MRKAETQKDVEKDWLKLAFANEGFKSYVAFRDLQILKEIAVCIDKQDFYGAMEANGRRHEILKIAADARKADKGKEED